MNRFPQKKLLKNGSAKTTRNSHRKCLGRVARFQALLCEKVASFLGMNSLAGVVEASVNSCPLITVIFTYDNVLYHA